MEDVLRGGTAADLSQFSRFTPSLQPPSGWIWTQASGLAELLRNKVDMRPRLGSLVVNASRWPDSTGVKKVVLEHTTAGRSWAPPPVQQANGSGREVSFILH